MAELERIILCTIVVAGVMCLGSTVTQCAMGKKGRNTKMHGNTSCF